ncbi:FAD-dependent oxidoreductase [Streptomyces thinghirensis]|nr:FAD-dependent oxidoreductase [Streptomyces thinghirensis]
MKHRIVVLGAGTPGAFAAGNPARRLSPADTEITVVNAVPVFVERMRLHQLASGQDVAFRELADACSRAPGVAAPGARHRRRSERRTVAVTGEDGPGEPRVPSRCFTRSAAPSLTRASPGRPSTLDVTGRPSALRLRERLAGLDEGGTVLVVGEGADRHRDGHRVGRVPPDLRSRSPPAASWAPGSPGACRHLRRAFARLGITVHEHTRIEEVEPTRTITAGGASVLADVTVWSAGFAVHPIAASSGLEVAETGQIVVDRTMRSVSHPDVYAAGDCAYAIGDNGRPLPMSCASAGFTSTCRRPPRSSRA